MHFMTCTYHHVSAALLLAYRAYNFQQKAKSLVFTKRKTSKGNVQCFYSKDTTVNIKQIQVFAFVSHFISRVICA